jgi:cellulose synthase/poly-beta-1,6-N-acetylglucosamine synthase-like glycosyltransferase/exo-beta-1,3-glucanase (GH17 family)
MRLIAGVVALVVCGHAGLWALLHDESTAPDVQGPLSSVSFAPYHGSKSPDAGNRPTPAQIRSDLKIISPYTTAIRTYSSTGGGELVPGIANEFGLRVAAGAWLDNDAKRNERELRAVVDLAKRNRNINAIVVGNETIFRGETILVGDEKADPDEVKRIQAIKDPKDRQAEQEKANVAKLIKVIQRVKREVQVPVTTGDTLSNWERYPELVSAVDFIAVHILDYWNGEPEANVVDLAINHYNNLRAKYPGKRIVIAEFGWPSAGYNYKGAKPGRTQQARVLRDFVARAEALGIDYNIVEATDQPWKTFEGSVGPYWGLFDANRNPKFSWSGPISSPGHWKTAGVAVLLGLLLSLPITRIGRATFGEVGLLAVSANAVGAWFAAVFAYWTGHYFVVGAAIALGLGGMLLVPLVLIALSRMQDIASVAFGARQRSKLLQPIGQTLEQTPKVSIHVPAYREPPEMLKLTLDAVARLEYPNFECVVVINNTPEPEYWRPIEEHCATLGERFKFVYAEKISGFKAGALRLALNHTAEDATIIGVIDADYVVTPDWLKDLVPAFADPQVGLVQAPQDHRDGDKSPLHRAMNGEYAGFFDIGMIERNEVNAIIVHGTMCLIRRSALESAGGWAGDTIVEDSDLGLSILEQGWRALYTNRRYGHGLLPDTYEQFQKQRHRWAYGGVQIIKKHWRRFLPGASRLTPEQKREYAIGWLNWLGAESIGVAVAILNLLWVPVVAFVGIAIPDKILTVPIIAAFAVSLMHFAMLYRLRVAIPGTHMFGSLFAAMSVQWTVARAVCDGLIKDNLPFARTAKGGATRRLGRDFPAFWEAVLAALLLLGAAVLVATNHVQVQEIYVFAAVLVVQSLPFLSAAGLAALERTRANDFVFWRAIGTRVVEILPRRTAVAAAPAQVPTENRIDAAQ